MPIRLAIDDHLLAEALKVGGYRTKRETVNEALKEYIERRRRHRLVNLIGKIDFHPTCDDKQARRKR